MLQYEEKLRRLVRQQSKLQGQNLKKMFTHFTGEDKKMILSTGQLLDKMSYLGLKPGRETGTDDVKTSDW